MSDGWGLPPGPAGALPPPMASGPAPARRRVALPMPWTVTAAAGVWALAACAVVGEALADAARTAAGLAGLGVSGGWFSPVALLGAVFFALPCVLFVVALCQGRNWGRIVLTVFAGLGIMRYGLSWVSISGATTAGQRPGAAGSGSAGASSGAQIAFSLAITALLIAAIVLHFAPATSAYIRACSTARAYAAGALARNQVPYLPAPGAGPGYQAGPWAGAATAQSPTWERPAAQTPIWERPTAQRPTGERPTSSGSNAAGREGTGRPPLPLALLFSALSALLALMVFAIGWWGLDRKGGAIFLSEALHLVSTQPGGPRATAMVPWLIVTGVLVLTALTFTLAGYEWARIALAIEAAAAIVFSAAILVLALGSGLFRLAFSEGYPDMSPLGRASESLLVLGAVSVFALVTLCTLFVPSANRFMAQASQRRRDVAIGAPRPNPAG